MQAQDALPFAWRELDRDAEHCQLLLDRIYLTYSVGSATRENIASLVEKLQTFFRGLPAGQRGVFVLVTKGTARPPAAESRDAVVRVLKQHADKLDAIAIVIGVPGFAGAALRAVASTLFVLSLPNLHVKFFGSTAECATWVARRANDNVERVSALFTHAEQLVPK